MSEAYLELANSSVAPLRKQENTVGRVPENDVCISDASLSRFHASIIYENSIWQVVDKGSKNKTCVNNVPIPPNQPTPLEDNADLHFGHYKARFRIGEAPDIDATMQVDLPANINEVMKDLDTAPGASESAPAAASRPAASSPPADPSQAPPEAFAALEPRSTTSNPFYLTKLVTKIGSDPRECDIVLDDRQVSLVHAEVKVEKGKIKLIDLNSKEGTRVNDGRKKRFFFLNDGDKIAIGGSAFSYRFIRYPEDLDPTFKKKKKSSPALLFLIVILLLIVGGMGYFAYQNMYAQPQTEATQQVIRDRPEQKAFSFQPVYDLVQENQFGEAVKLLNTMEQGGIPEDQLAKANQIDRDLNELSEASIGIRLESYADAYNHVLNVDEQSPVFNFARPFIRDVENRYHQRIEVLKRQARDMERDGKWDETLRALRDLKDYAKEPEVVVFVDTAIRRIELKKELEDVYSKQVDNVNTYYDTVLKVSQPTLEKAEKAMNSDSNLRRDLEEDYRKLRDLMAHAELLSIYKKFSGNAKQVQEMEAIVADPEKLSVSYEHREELQRYLKRAKTVMILTDDYRKYFDEYNALSEESDTMSIERAEPLVAMISTLDKIRETLEDPEIPMYSEASNLMRSSEDWLTSVQREMLQDAKKIQSGSSALDTAMTRRAKLTKLLKLFPDEAYESIEESSEDTETLSLIIKNSEQRAIFTSAYKDYTQKGVDVVNLLNEAKLNQSMSYDEIVDYLERLRENSLTQDQDILWRLEDLMKDMQ